MLLLAAKKVRPNGRRFGNFHLALQNVAGNQDRVFVPTMRPRAMVRVGHSAVVGNEQQRTDLLNLRTGICLPWDQFKLFG